MSSPIQFDRPAASDPVYLNVPLRHVLELPVLGVMVRYESNSAAVLEAVEETFGEWRALLQSPELIDQGSVRVRLIVHDDVEGAASHAKVIWRLVDPRRLLIHTAGSVGLMDMDRQDSVVYFTPALLADRAHFEYAVLHTMTVPLVDTHNRYPVHAAFIARGQVGLLLAGPAGTGKSTIAFEAHRRGLRVLSDDVAHIQLRPEFRVWGEIPGQVYLTPQARARFPELAGDVPSLVANGTEKLFIQFPYAWSGAGGGAPMAPHVGVCLLERNGGQASLTPVAPKEVETFLRNGLGIARTMFGDGVDEALRRVAAGGGWKLKLTDDPNDALPFLDKMFTALEQRD